MTLEQLADGRTKLVSIALFHSAAERDGLKNGDLLLKANGKALDGAELIGTLLQTGDPINFELTRAGKTMTVKVKPNPR